MIRDELQDCYDSQNVFGKEPEQLRGMLSVFMDTLEIFDTTDIRQAFEQWRAEQPNMPTASDIGGLCSESAGHRRKLREMEAQKNAIIPYEPREVRRVSWAFKNWQQMDDEMRDELANHLNTFDDAEKLYGYKKYLRNMCGVPADWLGIGAGV